MVVDDESEYEPKEEWKKTPAKVATPAKASVRKPSPEKPKSAVKKETPKKVVQAKPEPVARAEPVKTEPRTTRGSKAPAGSSKTP